MNQNVTLGSLSGKKAFVYGLGKTGITTAIAIAREGGNVLLWDDRNAERPDELKGIDSISVCRPHELDWSTVDYLVKSPGIPMDAPLVNEALRHGVLLINDVDLLYTREKGNVFIGITGTNGKSTTTALVHHLLKAAGKEAYCGGNLGIPALALPSAKGRDKAFYVLEVSSYQLEMMNSTVFDVAVLLNITPDHLDRHGNMEGYLAAKARIFERQHQQHCRVIGVDDAELSALAATLKNEQPTLQTHSLHNHTADAAVDAEGLLRIKHAKGDLEINCARLKNLPGPHNWQNIAAAVLAVRAYLTDDEITAGLQSFVGLPHRVEQVFRIGKVRFINDSKATNAQAAIAALRSFKNIYWIVGGLPKAEGITPCLEHTSQVRAAFVIGSAMDAFCEELKQHNISVFPCGTLEKAVYEAWRAADHENMAESYVLLSPACASFDQFNSFEHRGDVFASLCRDLQANTQTGT